MTSDANTAGAQSLDFFISYSPADERWATWLAATLEAAGYRTMVQAWDFVAGTRFIELMDRGVSESAIILAVLSRSYLRSRYGRMEWQAALRAAPENPETKLVTVRVEDCDITGLLAQITYVDLVGVDDPGTARDLVLRRVRDTLAGRATPEQRPSYPGAGRAPAEPPAATRENGAAQRRTPVILPDYPSAATTASGRGDVTLLHVSGPRFGEAHGRSADPASDTLHARIFSDVTQLVHEGAPKPDLIVVSGDLTATGGRAQFQTAHDTLSRLRVRLGLEPDRLIVVPGALDVNRPACRAHFNDCEADDMPPTPPYWPKWRHFSWLFRELYQGIDEVVFEYGQPWTLFAVPPLRLVVAGLNSSIPVSHRDEDNYGAIESEQAAWFAHRLHEYEDAGWLRLGVMRHGLGPERDELRDTALFNRLVAPRLNLLVHGPGARSGDAHETAGGLTTVSLSRPGEAELLQLKPDALVGWGVGNHDGPQRTAQRWRAAGATFAPERAPETEVRETASPADQLLDQIEEVCLARHERVRVRRVKGARPYLIATYNDAGVVRQLGVAAHIGEPVADDVDAFYRMVHAADADLNFEVVYKGSSPAQEVRQAAREAGIRLRSFTEFQGLLDLRDYVAAQTARLTSDRRYPPDLYVPQRYTELDRDDELVRDDLIGELLRQVRGEHGRFILVLGEFGRGKTFALRQLGVRIATELPHLIPIFIELRELDKAHSIEGMVAAHLADHGEQSIDLRAFRYMLEQGRIVLLFDGFDELVTRTTYERATDHLDALLAAASEDAKIIVTSRTQHFKSRAQVFTKLGEKVGMLPQRRVLAIKEFTLDQIRAYLVNYFGGDVARAEARLRLISGVENLVELSYNPRMLGFIAALEESRLRAVARVGQAVSAASLYREILSAWLEFEERRTQDVPGGAGGLGLPQLWRAVTVLALRLWESNESVLRLSDLAEVADTLDDLTDGPFSTEHTTHAIGTGTLLVRTDDGLFGFIHSSIVEWLVSNEIAGQLGQGKTALLSTRPLSQLSVDFLCDLAAPRVCEQWTNAVQDDPAADDVALRNARRISTRLKVPAHADLRGAFLQNEDLSYRDLAEVDLTGADLGDARLVGANLAGAVLRDARLVGTRLDEAVLTDADLTGADLSRARLTRADLRGATVTGSRWLRAALINTTVDADLLARPELNGVAVAPGMPVEAQLAPATIGVPYGFHIQYGRLPLPLAYSADGAALSVGCDNGTVVICDAATALPIRTMLGHHGRVYAVVPGRGNTLITAGADHTLRRWDLSTGRQLWIRPDHDQWVWPVVVSPDGTLVATSDHTGTVFLIEADTGRVRHRLLGATAPVWTAAFAPDGKRLATGGSSSAVQIWDTATGHLITELSGHSGARPERELADHPGSVYRVLYAPGGDAIVTTDETGTVRAWDVASGRLRHQFDGHRRAVYALDVHPGGDMLASADTGGVIRLWSLRTGAFLGGLDAHTSAVYQVQFSADGDLLASCDSSGSARLWSVDGSAERPARLQAELLGHRAALWPGSFSPDGRQFATASNDGTVRLWETLTGQCQRILRGHGRRINSVSFSPDRSLLAACGNDGVVRLWDPASGQQVRVLAGAVDQLVSAVFSPAGNVIAAAGNGGQIHMFRADSGTADRELDVETENVWTEAFDPSGDVLATASDDDTVRLWYHRTGAQGHTLAEHRGRVRSIAFGPAGGLLATGCDDSKVRLWDLSDGACTATLIGHTSRVYAVAFDANGSRLASAGWDGAVRIWDVDTGTCTATLSGSTGRLWTVVFHPDGRRLVCAGDNGDLLVWDSLTGDLLQTLTGHTNRVLTVTVSADGTVLASGADDGTVRLWNVLADTVTPRATLIGQPQGWAAVGPDGSYKGDVATGDFWYVVGACRFEPGELDADVPDVHRIAIEAPF